MQVFVNNVSGSPSNNGLTPATAKATIPQALAVPTSDQITDVLIYGTGTPYTDPIDVHYYRGVNLRKDPSGSASPILRAASQATLIKGQDHCLLGMSDLKVDLGPGGTGAILVHLRQFAIFDAVNIDWGGGAVANSMIHADTFSAVNLSGSHSVNGSANSFVSALNSDMKGSVNVLMAASGYTFGQGFFYGGKNALLDASGIFFSGPGGNTQTTGYQAVVTSGSKLWRPSVYGGAYPIPGTTGIANDASSFVF